MRDDGEEPLINDVPSGDHSPKQEKEEEKSPQI